MTTPEFVIFDVHGGIGKHIAATSVASSIKAAYPDSKLIVVAAWPRVFLHHPDVWRVYGHAELRYFYNDYIHGKDFLFLKSEPYHHTDYIAKRRHLIDVWTEQCGVPLVAQKPSLYLTTREIDFVTNKCASIQKPILVLQTNGGTGQPFPYSWARDISPKTAKRLVDLLAKDFAVMHLRRKEQLAIENTIPVIADDIRELFALVKIASRRLLIDSFAQHATAALDEHATVLLPLNNVKILGYETNTNVVSTVQLPADVQSPFSYIEDYRMDGPLVDYPFGTEDIFDADRAVEMVKAGPVKVS